MITDNVKTFSFKKTHFGRSNGALGMNLCHVMAWSDIRCRLDILFEQAYNSEKVSEKSNDENYNDLRDFINKLFEIDNEAVVNFGPWYPPLTLDSWDKPGQPWYEQTPFARPIAGGKKKHILKRIYKKNRYKYSSLVHVVADISIIVCS